MQSAEIKGGVNRSIRDDWEVSEMTCKGKCTYPTGLCSLAQCGAVMELRRVNLNLAWSSALTECGLSHSFAHAYGTFQNANFHYLPWTAFSVHLAAICRIVPCFQRDAAVQHHVSHSPEAASFR